MLIHHHAEEFTLNFVYVYPDGTQGKLLSSMIVSPSHVKRIWRALGENISQFESQFGAIQETPENVPIGAIGPLQWASLNANHLGSSFSAEKSGIDPSNFQLTFLPCLSRPKNPILIRIVRVTRKHQFQLSPLSLNLNEHAMFGVGLVARLELNVTNCV